MQTGTPNQQTPVVIQPPPVNVTINPPPPSALPWITALVVVVGWFATHLSGIRKDEVTRRKQRRDKQIDALAELVSAAHLFFSCASDYSRLDEQRIEQEYDETPSAPEDRNFFEEFERVKNKLSEREAEANRTAALFFIVTPPELHHPSSQTFMDELASIAEAARSDRRWWREKAGDRFKMLSLFASKQERIIRTHGEDPRPWYMRWRKLPPPTRPTYAYPTGSEPKQEPSDKPAVL